MEDLLKMDVISQIKIQRFEDKVNEILTPKQREDIFGFVLDDISREEFENKTQELGYSKLLKEMELMLH